VKKKDSALTDSAGRKEALAAGLLGVLFFPKKRERGVLPLLSLSGSEKSPKKEEKRKRRKGGGGGDLLVRRNPFTGGKKRGKGKAEALRQKKKKRGRGRATRTSQLASETRIEKEKKKKRGRAPASCGRARPTVGREEGEGAAPGGSRVRLLLPSKGEKKEKRKGEG